MKKFIVLLVISVSCCGMNQAEANPSTINLYASPNGTGNGLSADSPADIQSVKTLARSYNAANNVTIYLRGGMYDMISAGPLVLTSADSGRNGYQVIWRSYPGDDPPVLSGGVKISGWTLHDAAKNIWKAPVPVGYKARQLWVNGQKADRTRWFGNGPNFATTRTYDSSYHWKQSLKDENFPMLTYPADVELVQRGDTNMYMARWQHMIWGVTTTSRGGDVTTFSIPKDIITINNKLRSFGRVLTNTFSWIENAYDFLDSTSRGQWFLPSTENFIYYVPRDGEDMATAECWLPHREILIQSSSGLANVTFLGISFQYTGWLKPTIQKSFIEIQANHFFDSSSDYRDWSEPMDSVKSFPQAAVQVFGADNVNFYQCKFAHLGGMGLYLGLGSHDSSISGNLFTDISSNAMVIGSIVAQDANDGTTGSLPAVKTKNILVQSNHIYNVANQYNGGVGVLVGYTNNVKVLHNDIHDVPYTGISIGWGWTLMSEDWYLDPDWGLGIRDYSGNNEVAYNILKNTMQTLFDGGAIYSTGAQPGSTIHDNYIINCGRADYLQDYFRGGLNSIYYDEGSRYGEAFNNVILKSSTDFQTFAVAANLDLSRGELSVYNNYYTMPLGLYGYGTPYYSEGALRWGKTSGNSRIAGDPSTWSANVQAITATTGKELVLHSNIFQSSAVIFGWKSIDSELSILSIDPNNGYKISNYEDFDTGMWRANVYGITDNLAALVAYEGTAPTIKIDVTETTNLTPELSATLTLSDDAQIIVESSRRTYSKIQTAYDDLETQTDKLKIKKGELVTGNLYFDRNVNVKLEGGYDSDFSNNISTSSFYGSLTITDGCLNVSHLTIK